MLRVGSVLFLIQFILTNIHLQERFSIVIVVVGVLAPFLQRSKLFQLLKYFSCYDRLDCCTKQTLTSNRYYLLQVVTYHGNNRLETDELLGGLVGQPITIRDDITTTEHPSIETFLGPVTLKTVGDITNTTGSLCRVSQGSNCSPPLFHILIDPLAISLYEAITTRNIPQNALLADDVIVYSKYLLILQTL